MEIHLKFGAGDLPIDAVAVDPTGTENPRRIAELLNVAAGRATIARVGQRLFGHSLTSNTKDGLMRCGQSWWEHSYKNATGDKDALERYRAFAEAQGDPFLTMASCAPDCIIYFSAARWADQGFPTVTMGERLAAALCGTNVPEEWYDEIKAPWKAFVIEIPAGLLTIYDPEHQVRTRATRVLVHNIVAEDGVDEWWWMLFSEREQHLWREGTIRQVLYPVEFGDKEAERYRVHAGGEAFGEHINQDERIYHLVSRLIFNTILTLLDPDQVRAVGLSHKRYESNKNRNDRTGPPEQRVFVIGRPIKLDCRGTLRDYLEGRSKKSFKITTQFLVHGHWRWQPWGPKNSLRRRQWIEPYWKGPEDGVIPVRDHDLGSGSSDP